MISAGHRTLTAGETAAKATRDAAAAGADLATDEATADLAEATARHAARRFALALMAGSGVLAIAIFGALWWLLRGML